MNFNNIEAWLEYFDTGLITEEQLSTALFMRIGSSNPEHADLHTAAMFCAAYGIHLPVTEYDPKYPGVPCWCRCAHYTTVLRGPPHCKRENNEHTRLVAKRLIREDFATQISTGRRKFV